MVVVSFVRASISCVCMVTQSEGRDREERGAGYVCVLLLNDQQQVVDQRLLGLQRGLHEHAMTQNKHNTTEQAQI